jgi:hypothetical protein
LKWSIFIRYTKVLTSSNNSSRISIWLVLCDALIPSHRVVWRYLIIFERNLGLCFCNYLITVAVYWASPCILLITMSQWREIILSSDVVTAWAKAQSGVLSKSLLHYSTE